jgi:hypothetical protein
MKKTENINSMTSMNSLIIKSLNSAVRISTVLSLLTLVCYYYALGIKNGLFLFMGVVFVVYSLLNFQMTRALRRFMNDPVSPKNQPWILHWVYAFIAVSLFLFGAGILPGTIHANELANIHHSEWNKHEMVPENETYPNTPIDWQAVADRIIIITCTGRELQLEGTLEELEKIGMKREDIVVHRNARDPSGNANRGAWYSHRRVAEEIVRDGLKRALVFEDDPHAAVEWINHMTVKRVADWLDENEGGYDVFYLGAWVMNKFAGAELTTDHIWKTFSVFTHAYIMPYETAKKLSTMEWQPAKYGNTLCWATIGCENMLDYDFFTDMLPRAYSVYPMMFFQRDVISTRRKGRRSAPSVLRRHLEACERVASIYDSGNYCATLLVYEHPYDNLWSEAWIRWRMQGIIVISLIILLLPDILALLTLLTQSKLGRKVFSFHGRSQTTTIKKEL